MKLSILFPFKVTKVKMIFSLLTSFLIFFAHPYHSWERGSNESLNGLVMQCFPKGSDFRKLSKLDLKGVQDKLNSRPRKRFNFKSPIFVMNKLLFNQKLHL